MTVDGNPTTYEYNNSPVTISIPAGSQYTIQLGTIENYYTPTDSNTYTAVAGATNNLSYTYSASLVTFSFTPSNATMTLKYYDETMANIKEEVVGDGDTLLIPCPLTGTYYFPLIQEFHPLEGYRLPAWNVDGNMVKIEPGAMTIEREWIKCLTGVFIVDAGGNQVLYEDWEPIMGATGVGLVNDNVSIIIAPKSWYTTDGLDYDGPWNGNIRSAWGGHDKTVTGVKITTSESDAITDFDGSSNTDAIISQLMGLADNNTKKDPLKGLFFISS